jgi:hypothetical protein
MDLVTLPPSDEFHRWLLFWQRRRPDGVWMEERKQL